MTGPRIGENFTLNVALQRQGAQHTQRVDDQWLSRKIDVPRDRVSTKSPQTGVATPSRAAARC